MFLTTATHADNLCIKMIDRHVARDHLNLADCELKENDMPAILSYLAEHPQIKSLSLERNEMKSGKPIVMLAQNATLTSLNLNQVWVDDEGAKALASNNTLKDLNITVNTISNEGGIALAKNTHLESLNISLNIDRGHRMDVEAANAFAKNTTLKHLNIAYSNIGSAGVLALAKNNNLISLDVSDVYNHVPISNEAITALANNTHLTHLSLNDTIISADGLRMLAKNQNLKELDLHTCQIDDEAAKILAQSSTITSLNLACNPLTAVGAKALASMPALTHLIIDKLYCSSTSIKDPLGDEGAIALANTHLIKLYISDNKVGPAGAQALAKIPTLKMLDISHNGIKDDGIIALAGNKALKLLMIDYVAIGDQGFAAIANSSSLHTLYMGGGFTKLSDDNLKTLASSTSLKYLNISGEMTPAGVRALAESKSLKALTIQAAFFGDAGTIELAKHTTIPMLDLSVNNNIETEGALALAKNMNIKVLLLDNHDIAQNGIDALQQNQNITYLDFADHPFNYLMRLYCGNPIYCENL